MASPVFRNYSEIRATLENVFPGLKNTNWLINSPYDDTYQCIALAASRFDRKWWPGGSPPEAYWPLASCDDSVDSFIRVFQDFGYTSCSDAVFEVGYQKVAIYADRDMVATHMARQHIFGRGWLSKLGDLEDIIHSNLSDIEGSTDPFAYQYGIVVQVMKRSLLSAIAHRCIVRSSLAALKFLLFRLKNREWCRRRLF